MMRSVSKPQQARYGTLTLPVRLGWYDVLKADFGEPVARGETMFVVLPVKPERRRKMAKELRAIAKQLEDASDAD